jgi:hypothetical protein
VVAEHGSGHDKWGAEATGEGKSHAFFGRQREWFPWRIGQLNNRQKVQKDVKWKFLNSYKKIFHSRTKRRTL